MLNLTVIAMPDLRVRQLIRFTGSLLAALIWLSWPLLSASGQTPPAPAWRIDAPLGGEAVQGQVRLLVRSDTGLEISNLVVEFAYSSDPTGTWFLIGRSDELPVSGPLLVWETGNLTDGDYDLRISALVEGETQTQIIRGVRLRNYSPVETSTPTATPQVFSANPSATPTPTATSTPAPGTPTPLPSNQAALSLDDAGRSALWGAAGALAVFVLFGIYLLLRSLWLRR